MTTYQLDPVLESYMTKLIELEESVPNSSLEQIMDVLLARDAVEIALVDNIPDSTPKLIKIVELDTRLKEQAAFISQKVKLVDWRASLRRPARAWWWSLEKYVPPHRATRLDWLWRALSVVFFTLSLSLAIDISTRFLTGGPNFVSALAIMSQATLALFAAGGILTKAGQQGFSKILDSFKIPSHFRQETHLVLAVLLFGLILVFWLSLPTVAVRFNNTGRIHHNQGKLTSAQYAYQRAVSLSPDYVEAHYNLGLLYEDILDFEAAQREYQIAVQGGLDAAYNNLARLYILENQTSKAVSLLQDGLELVQDDEVHYDMLKNLGWARLLQKRYPDAKAALNQAVVVVPGRAAAHCLLAQVLDAQESAEARDEWLKCVAEASSHIPEEDEWIGLAQERLQATEEP